MTRGTRSVLYGAHCFFLHPWFVARAWWRLYGAERVYIGYRAGFPNTLRWRLGFRGGPVFASILTSLPLWVAFFVHDLGYVGKKEMDDADGETHPLFGARLLSRLFEPHVAEYVYDSYHGGWRLGKEQFGVWGEFALLHSRFYAKRLDKNPSRLCAADKLSFALTPSWLYLPMTRATGELAEYMSRSGAKETGTAEGNKYAHMNVHNDDPKIWFANLADYVTRWAETHKDGRPDTWTPSQEAKR